MLATDPLLRTKLRLPSIRPALVHRAHLQTHLAQGLAGPLTLVIAPAGFGKTTLAASCAAASGMPAAWLSLDKNDNQPGRFLTYLIAALQTANPAVGRDAAQLMAGVQKAQSEAVLTSLINDLDGSGSPLLLALDDYQFITATEVHAAVTFLLEHCPADLHLLVTSRSDPPLPIARLRARGQLVELRAADLRFTSNEAAAFLNEVMGLCLDPGQVDMLEARTEGWIAGLQMAALSIRDHENAAAFIKSFSGTNRHILDYLLEEILAHQPPDIQQFLLKSSILERLSAPLCDAVLDCEGASPSSAAVLEYLERENLFLVPLDDERVWFRYHHLFADLLRARLGQVHPHRVNDFHIRASVWFEQHGFILDAIQHLFAVGENNQAADLIERYGSEKWIEGDPSLVQAAESLPPEILNERPKIGLYQVWFLITQGNIGKAQPLMERLAQHFAEVCNPDQAWMRTVLRLALAFLAPPGNLSNLIPLPASYQELDDIPDGELILRDVAEILYGMTLARRGELEHAVEVSLKSLQRHKALQGVQAPPGGVQAIPTLVPFLARIYMIQGRLRAAASLCREFLDPLQAREFRFLNSAASLHIVLGEVLCEWNFVEEAEKQIRQGLQANEPWQNIMTDGFGLPALACVLQSKGDTPAAMQVVDQFEARMREVTRPREFDEDIRTLRVRTQLAMGDLHSAVRWADHLNFSDDYHAHPELYLLTLARVRFAEGLYPEVVQLLTGITSRNLLGNRIKAQIEAGLVTACAQAAMGNLPEAFTTLDTCLALGQEEGYTRVFLNGGDPIRNLLSAALRESAIARTGYARQLLSAFTPSLIPPDTLLEPLSEREMEVLRLMAQGNTNPQIARRLVVAPGTIKAHAASIYRKLDADNRTQAVVRARALGILS